MQAYITSITKPRQDAVWLFIDSQTVGGIESHVANLAIALHQRGHKVSVVFWRDYAQTHPMLQQLNQQKVPWLILDGSVGSLLHAVNDLLPSVIHSHGYKAGLISRMLRLIKPIKLVSSFHAGEVSKGRLAWYDCIDRYSAGLSHVRIAISEDIANRLAASSEIINNFVEVPNQVPAIDSQDKPTIGFVGRLTHVKGPDRFYQLAKALPQFNFVVFGEGELKPSKSYALLENLQCRGKQNCMDACWQEIDLLCMPSRNEGLPLAALEAMGRGIPVIASDVGALPTLISDHKNGFLLAGFDLQQWISSIVEWSENAALRQCVAIQASKTVEQHYSAQAVLPQFENIYQCLSDA
ncbi:glycosyltransferase family 4 protein [Agarivorans sp. DSG3-1]|uniref:glycosyltransferase family 4 protein n=1 Tax=Agarivorans sp. DSG3-1 TaxID=3342249 RepID=UPI00398E91A8